MKGLIISGFVAVAVLAAATTLRSHSISSDRAHAASLKKSTAVSGNDELPIEEFEDMSLVFSTPAKH